MQEQQEQAAAHKRMGGRMGVLPGHQSSMLFALLLYSS
jgi:hypothetical protein